MANCESSLFFLVRDRVRLGILLFVREIFDLIALLNLERTGAAGLEARGYREVGLHAEYGNLWECKAVESVGLL